LQEIFCSWFTLFDVRLFASPQSQGENHETIIDGNRARVCAFGLGFGGRYARCYPGSGSDANTIKHVRNRASYASQYVGWLESLIPLN